MFRLLRLRFLTEAMRTSLLSDFGHVCVCVFMHAHIRIVLLTLVIWGRGIGLQHQLLDGALEKKRERERGVEEEESPCYFAW